MTRTSRLLAGAALAAGAVALIAPAQASVKVGVLSCHVSGGVGFIFGSSKDLRCNFTPNHGFPELYAGTVQKYGLDIGYTAGGRIIWDVFAPTAGFRRGALDGSYAGATAGATVGVGAGANVLVGGSDRSFTLQPVSIEGNTGLNIAAGIGAIDLHYLHPVAAPEEVGPPPEEGPEGPPPSDQGPQPDEPPG